MKPILHFPTVILCVVINFGMDLHLKNYSLAAHEFWIAPSTHFPSLGDKVDLYAMIGHGIDAEPFPRDDHHIKNLTVSDVMGERTTQGINYQLPTASFSIRSEGQQLIAYESQEQISVLPGKKFDHYLMEEGLINAHRTRETKENRGEEVREGYTRCAKSILIAQSAKLTDRWLGLPLELKVLNTSIDFSEKKTLALKLHLNGEPLQGALVKAVCLNEKVKPMARRTQADGTVVFECQEAGRWVFNTVHMEPGTSSDTVDWHSFWGSLTLELKPEINKKNEQEADLVLHQQ